MSSTTPRGPAPDSPSGVRPLPPRPSLEFERRAAKKLLGQLRRGDPDALRRERAHRHESRDETGFKLADAQFLIAREYGFRSWPRLVEYFTTLERHERSEPWSIQHREGCEDEVRSLLADFLRRSAYAGALFVNFLPRFFGMAVDDVFDAAVTEEDARLVVARMYLAPSWEALIERTKHNPPDDAGDWSRHERPMERARYAIRIGNLGRLAALVEAHPDLLRPPPPGDRWAGSLIRSALQSEHDAVVGGSASRLQGPILTAGADARRITDWLIARGADPTPVLDRALLGHAAIDTSAASVEFWLARGADPTRMPANGIPVLEHALYRYRNGAAIDVLAPRVAPREGLWIAAGLGDLRALDRYIARKGRLTPAARETRPDFTATGRLMISLPEADDLEIMWEAFFISGLNQRFAAMDRLLEAGFPMSYSKNWLVLIEGVNRRSVPLVEYLVSRGASTASPEWSPRMSASEGAMMFLKSDPSDPQSRRMVELLGGDPDQPAREASRTPKQPTPVPPLLDALQWASDEARRRSGASIEPDDILAAILRGPRSLPLTYFMVAGVDIPRLRELLGPRLEPVAPTGKPQLPFSARAQEAMDQARARAMNRNSDRLHALHVLGGLAAAEDGPVAELLRAAGSSPARLRETLGGV